MIYEISVGPCFLPILTPFTMLSVSYKGCASGMATCFTHPLDLTKVQMQTAKANNKSTFQFISSIVRTHGVRGLYDGLSAAFLRA